jgi:hypothetical protein
VSIDWGVWLPEGAEMTPTKAFPLPFDKRSDILYL